MSLTKGERSALRWLLAVIAIGSGAQVARQWQHGDSIRPESAEALSLQLLAVDSAQRAGKRASSRRSGSRRGARSHPTEADRSAPSASKRRSRRVPRSPDSTVASARELPTLERVDLDRADVVLLERLPKIGPALAARIVADREARGAFGSLGALERVRGIGPKLAAGLSALVTFSGTPRPSTVQR